MGLSDVCMVRQPAYLFPSGGRRALSSRDGEALR
jgi:hypothetical protein